MNRRIQKKRLDAVNRMVVENLQLYAIRPRHGPLAAECETLARDLLGLSLGFALRERLQVLPGPRHGCKISPPTDVVVAMPDPATITAQGQVIIRDRRGERDVGTEQFRLIAQRTRSQWKLTLVSIGSGAGVATARAV